MVPDTCFNGATPFQTWKLICPTDQLGCIPCFNGATPFQTWKWRERRRHVISTPWLQWGHAFSDVEMSPLHHSNCRPSQLQWGHAFSDVEIDIIAIHSIPVEGASMGPRLFRRGNRRREVEGEDHPLASMGPRLFRRGNSRTGPDTSSSTAASMGPRLFRRGNCRAGWN